MSALNHRTRLRWLSVQFYTYCRRCRVSLPLLSQTLINPVLVFHVQLAHSFQRVFTVFTVQTDT